MVMIKKIPFLLVLFLSLLGAAQDPIFETNFEVGSFVDKVGKSEGIANNVMFENVKKGMVASFDGKESVVKYDI